MIDLNINGTIYRHPNKIEEVNLKQYISLMAVEHDESKTPLENNLKGFSEFADIPMDALKSAPAKEVMYYISQLTNMLSEIDVDKDMIDKFKVGRFTYYVNQDIDGADMAQYVDCTHMMNLMNSEPEYFPYMMAIYCLRKNEIYDDVDLEKRAAIMMKANVVDAIKVNTFFLTTSQNYVRDFQLYLVKRLQANKSKLEVAI